MDVIAVLDRLGAQLAGLGALKLHVMIGAQSFDHRIEAFTRPWQQVTKLMDRDPIATFTDTLIGGEALLVEDVRLDKSGELLLVIEPAAQGLSQGGIA